VTDPKRLKNSLDKLKENVDKNKISFPAIKKKLREFEKKYSFIQINLKEPSLIWNTIDELENKSRKLDGNYLLKTNRLDLSQHKIWSYYMMLTRVENALLRFKIIFRITSEFSSKRRSC